RRVTGNDRTAVPAPAHAEPVEVEREPRPKLRYKRILLKLSGEALQGPASYGIDFATVEAIARQVKAVVAQGVQVGMVLGGGGHLWGRGAGGGAGEGAAPRRLQGHAGGGDECPGAATRDGEHGAAYARAARGHHARGRRAVYSPPRDPPLREGARRHLRRGHR